MSNHLTQNQMTHLILGTASAQEREHGRNCSQCGAELREFREAVTTFQLGMKEWSGLEEVPALASARAGSWQNWVQPSLRWVLVGMAVVAVVILPIYSARDFEPVAAGLEVVEVEENADALLMQEVAAHLSRPLPMSMERVMALLPNDSIEPEREKTR